jgi:tetratricopeptide (TPR) repeat protein
MLQQNPHTLAAQAQALIRSGNFAGAREIYQQICRLDQDNPDAWMTLGAIHGQLGDPAQAVSCLGKAIALRPDFPEARYNLGYILRGQGRLQDAAVHFEKAVAAKPDYFEAWLLLATTQGMSGAFDKAEESCQRAVALRPDSPDAYMGLGNVLLHQERGAESAAAFEKALQLKPGFAEAQIALGYACQIDGRHDVAVAHWQQALRLKPDSYEACLGIGKSLLPLCRPEEAWSYCERAVKLHPQPVDAIVQMATIADHSGDVNKAYELLLPLMDAGVNSIQAALVFARTSKELGRQNEAIDYVERVLATNPPMGAAVRRRVLFSLGKMYDAARNYDRAFECYRQANAARQWSFDARQHRAETDAFIAFHSPKFMARMPRASVRSDRPIFVVGMMRSGTTLVEQILSSHPAVFGAGELMDIPRIAGSLSAMLSTDVPYPQCLAQLSQEKMDELARTYLQRLESLSADAARVVDKLPQNFRYLGLIEFLFPDAHVIHCMRDPRDTCFSIYSLDFVSGHDYAFEQSNLGSFYRDYRRVMRHWRGILKIPLLEVQYEELVARPDEMIREIVAFCGLEWDDCCLNFHETKRYVNTPSYDQVRHPMYSKSVGRWKNYERHLGPLIEALGDEIET